MPRHSTHWRSTTARWWRPRPGSRVRDPIDGSEANVDARVLVNATGAWLEPTTDTLTGRRPGRIRTTKGIHIVFPPLTSSALVLFSRVDGRLLFAIPRAGLTWIGTTDTDYKGDPADARATRADVDYLVESVGSVFPSCGRRTSSTRRPACARWSGERQGVFRLTHAQIVEGARSRRRG